MNKTIYSLIVFFILLTFTECKKTPTTEELIYGRWYAKKSQCKKIDLTAGSNVISDTSINFYNEEYANFLKNGVFIFHRGNGIHDTSQYQIDGSRLRIISPEPSAGNAEFDTSNFEIVTLNEYALELMESRLVSPTLRIDTTLNLGR